MKGNLMSNRQDKKMARLMTNRLIRLRGWEKSTSRSDRRKYRNQIYQAIFSDIERSHRELWTWFSGPHFSFMGRWFKNVE